MRSSLGTPTRAAHELVGAYVDDALPTSTGTMSSSSKSDAPRASSVCRASSDTSGIALTESGGSICTSQMPYWSFHTVLARQLSSVVSPASVSECSSASQPLTRPRPVSMLEVMLAGAPSTKWKHRPARSSR